MLSAAELAMMRATQALTFDLTATITRLVSSEDGAGGQLPATPTTSTSACRLAPHKSALSEEVEAAMIQGKALWDITFPALTDVRYQDRIAIGGQEYEVISRYGPKSRETARMVLCVER
jgi:hypothetical protein